MPTKLNPKYRWLVRYGGALAAVGVGLLLRLALTAWVGPGLPTYITFYPAIMAVALLGGLGPGLLATAATVVAVDYWVVTPHEFGSESLAEVVGMGLFSIMGLFMTIIAELYRRIRLKAAAYDKELALRQSQDELRSAAEQRRLALEAADLGAWDYHFQTGEVFWDERCREMWGIPQAERIDYAGAIAAIHPEDRAAVDEAVKQALAGKDGGAYHREFRVVWPDGSVHWIASHGRVYFQGEGSQRRAIRFIGANREITLAKEAQAVLQQTAEELERSNRDLEHFAYVASHDLQEPLRVVGGYVKLLEHRFPDKLDVKAREYVAGAVDGALRMERLITDLLAFSRVGACGGTFVPADLDAVLDQALRNLQAGIESAHATVTHDPLPTLSVDATQLMQLFQNLIGNALKFHGEQPLKIHIGVRPEEGRWVFWVQDNGIGIDPQYFERIFQVFQRLHTRRRYPGTGIGLAICKKIVERHGGTIWVESQPGQGSTFCFSIPARSRIVV